MKIGFLYLFWFVLCCYIMDVSVVMFLSGASILIFFLIGGILDMMSEDLHSSSNEVQDLKNELNRIKSKLDDL